MNDTIKSINAVQGKRIMEQNEELDSWYRNPVIMLTLGIIAGGTAAVFLKK